MKKKFWSFSLIILIFLINFAFCLVVKAEEAPLISYYLNDNASSLVANPVTNPIKLSFIANISIEDWVSVRIEKKDDASTYKIYHPGNDCDSFEKCEQIWDGSISPSGKTLTDGTYQVLVKIKNTENSIDLTLTSPYTININPISLPEQPPATTTDATDTPPIIATTTPPISASSTPPEIPPPATTTDSTTSTSSVQASSSQASTGLILGSYKSSGTILFKLKATTTWGQVLGTSTAMITIKEKIRQTKIANLKKRLDLLGVKLNDLKILIAHQPVRPVKLVWKFW